MRNGLVLGVALTALGVASGANILAFHPLPVFSHTNAYLPIYAELARRGHNITVVSPYPRSQPLANYTDLVVTNTLSKVLGQVNFDLRDTNSVMGNMLGIWVMCPLFLDAVFDLPEVQAFISEDRSHFDLVILETFFCQEPFAALAHKYSAVLVGVQPVGLGPIVAEYTGSSQPWSYVPHSKIRAEQVMDFKQRFATAFYNTAELLINHFVYKKKQERYKEEYMRYPGWEAAPPLEEILYNHSLVLVDNHLSLSFPKPSLPNIVEIGGLSVQQPKPLSKELELLMSSAEDGVVLFSWGSHYKLTNMKPATLDKFLAVFASLPQLVLIKWEGPELQGAPSNVRTASWIPQAALLGHKKTKVFISHCGIHGLAEAVHHGVPILATPLFADQFQNAKVAEAAGLGLVLDPDECTEAQLRAALVALINDPKYKAAAVRQSKLMEDRPLSALDNAVYWLEYVLRHGGAPHLRPAVLRLSWAQYLLLDVIAAVGLVLLTLWLVLRLLLHLCCRPARSKAKEE